MSSFTELFKKYERPISSGALIIGFIIDSLTLRRVDLLIENIALIGYLIIIATSILVINLIETKRLKLDFWQSSHPFFLFAMQFAIGGIFSAFLVFYTRSASIAASWPFLLILAAQMIANEMLRDRYARLTFQIGVFFFALFSYATFAVPVVLRAIGTSIFLISGLVSLGFIFLFLWLLRALVTERFEQNRKATIAAVISVYAFINALYFANFIPPIPLSMQEAGIYNLVQRNPDATYALERDRAKDTWWTLRGDVLTLRPDKTLYAYTAIFAPTRLTTDIVHEWESFDVTRGRWVSQSQVSFSIVGGRDGGYRGYSFKRDMKPGLWRVNVETSDGRLVGRIKFKVI